MGRYRTQRARGQRERKRREYVECPPGQSFDSVAQMCKKTYEAYTFDGIGYSFVGKGTKTRLLSRIPKGSMYCFIPSTPRGRGLEDQKIALKQSKLRKR